jgi:phosphate transport system substrate-binding protein
MNALRITTVMILVAVTAVACTSVVADRDTTVEIRGSDTMLILNRLLAEAFMRSEPGVSVRVAGGGTGEGVQALIDGRANICAASRPLAADEVQAIFDAHQTLGVRFLVARDGLSIWVHPSNPVRDLNHDQLRGLFTGAIDRWTAVGGDAVPVHLVVRPPNSGTLRFFRDHVLGGDPFGAGAVVRPTTRAVVEAVADDPAAIGFGGVAYRTDTVVACRIDGVAPEIDAIRDETYPLARYLQLVTTEPPSGAARRFIDFCLSPAGQEIVAEVGYVPAWER